MTRIENGTLTIEEEPDGTCEMCGNTDELRPYGPNGESICFSCGMKDRATTDRQFERPARRGCAVTPLFSALAAMFLLLLTMAFGLLGHFYDIGVYTWVGSAICAVVSILALAVQEWMSR